MNWTKHLCFLGMATLTTVASGQIWLEFEDAPDGVPGHQATVGLGDLLEIRGSLDPALGDHVDTFCITITDPAVFYASTSEHLGGSLTPADLLADTRMWLWTQSVTDGSSDILLANDNDAFTPGDLASTVSSPINFRQLTGGQVHVTAAGITLNPNERYLLSISTFPNNPLDVNNIALATLDEPGTASTFLYGPNPQAGPFHHWDNGPSTESGPYVIALRGVAFCAVPEPSVGGAILLGMVILARYRRHASPSRKF